MLFVGEVHCIISGWLPERFLESEELSGSWRETSENDNISAWCVRLPLLLSDSIHLFTPFLNTKEFAVSERALLPPVLLVFCPGEILSVFRSL